MNILKELPSIPEIPSVTAPLRLGLTTRVMAKRHVLQKQREISSGEENRTYRRSSKFLKGTLLPNSIIKADMDALPTPKLAPKDHATIRKKRNEFVDKLTKQFQLQQETRHIAVHNHDLSKIALQKMLPGKKSAPPSTETSEKFSSRSSPSDMKRNTPKGPLFQALKNIQQRKTSTLSPTVLKEESASTASPTMKISVPHHPNAIQRLLTAASLDNRRLKRSKKQRRPSASFKKNPMVLSAEDMFNSDLEIPAIVEQKDHKTKRQPKRRSCTLKNVFSVGLGKQKTKTTKKKLSNDSETPISPARLFTEAVKTHNSAVIGKVLKKRRSTK